VYVQLAPKARRRAHSETPRAGENPAIPGIGSVASWSFTDGERIWQEPMNLLKTIERLLTECGRSLRMEGPVIVDIESQLSLRPLLHTMQPVHQNGVRTSTTIEIKHPTLILSPVFEYQHSAGPSLEESLMAGFRQVVRPRLHHACRRRPRPSRRLHGVF
jgi:hypothetical protein